jgi:hypothetical protein
MRLKEGKEGKKRLLFKGAVLKVFAGRAHYLEVLRKVFPRPRRIVVLDHSTCPGNALGE